jgi:disulfide bond formation protein DsbB
MLQRVFIIALLVIFLLAAIFIRGRKTQWLFNIVALLMTALGGLAAGRQIWLQHQSASAIQGLTCLPPVNFLLTNYPLEKVLHLMLKGSENCAQVHWFFMGLSLAEWSGVFFLISLLGILFQFRSIKKAR